MYDQSKLAELIRFSRVDAGATRGHFGGPRGDAAGRSTG
jgi:hypothetical protein